MRSPRLAAACTGAAAVVLGIAAPAAAAAVPAASAVRAASAVSVVPVPPGIPGAQVGRPALRAGCASRTAPAVRLTPRSLAQRMAMLWRTGCRPAPFRAVGQGVGGGLPAGGGHTAALGVEREQVDGIPAEAGSAVATGSMLESLAGGVGAVGALGAAGWLIRRRAAAAKP